jgi:xanthine dehydrogenase YagR molybdenum-binding subunit
VPELDVIFVGKPDTFSPIGIKGLGELGIIGVSAGIANAVYHAAGIRIRDPPLPSISCCETTQGGWPNTLTAVL